MLRLARLSYPSNRDRRAGRSVFSCPALEQWSQIPFCFLRLLERSSLHHFIPLLFLISLSTFISSITLTWRALRHSVTESFSFIKTVTIKTLQLKEGRFPTNRLSAVSGQRRHLWLDFILCEHWETTEEIVSSSSSQWSCLILFEQSHTVLSPTTLTFDIYKQLSFFWKILSVTVKAHWGQVLCSWYVLFGLISYRS